MDPLTMMLLMQSAGQMVGPALGGGGMNPGEPGFMGPPAPTGGAGATGNIGQTLASTGPALLGVAEMLFPRDPPKTIRATPANGQGFNAGNPFQSQLGAITPPNIGALLASIPRI